MRITSRIMVALRQNFLPGLILQAFALLLVGGFFFIPVVHDFCQKIGALKVEYGYLFSAISTGFFGGLLPFLLLTLSGRVKRGQVLFVALFYVLFWMWKGVEIDFLYRLQVRWFGEGTGILVILKKVVVDQFGYNLFYAVLCVAVFNRWKDCGFSISRCKSTLNKAFLVEDMPVMLVTTWMVWLPTCAIVYCLPSPLQIPLFNMALCFYVLLVAYVGDSREINREVKS
jgi:hypothetical protein